MQRMEERLGTLLTVGSVVSSALLAIGLVLWLSVGPQPSARIALEAGLIVLIATPVGRVAASTIGFVLRRDWRMVAMTALVLLSLVLSLIVACA
jgi:uncharacterized membrane protein